MKANKIIAIAAFGIVAAMLTGSTTGCNNSSAPSPDANKAAQDAKAQQLQSIQQNPNIPDSVKNQIAASAQGKNVDTGAMKPK